MPPVTHMAALIGWFDGVVPSQEMCTGATLLNSNCCHARTPSPVPSFAFAARDHCLDLSIPLTRTAIKHVKHRPLMQGPLPRKHYSARTASFCGKPLQGAGHQDSPDRQLLCRFGCAKGTMVWHIYI